MRKIGSFFMVSLFILTSCSESTRQLAEISGEMKKWHRVTLQFKGIQTSENCQENPFLDYRLNVTFKNGDAVYVVPGFYAADGNAGQTGASSGNVWKVHFCPDREGDWIYNVSFRKGRAIAINDDPQAGEPVYFDGSSGSFNIAATDKSGKDFRSKGKLEYIGEHYLRFAETGKYFLKGGADSPENFLAYTDFDGTRKGPGIGERPGDNPNTKELHSFTPHAADWNEGDPTWKNGKGKNIIGALNYLSSKGMNSVYMLTMNVMGDGDDVWPWTDRNERYRFDCSKLDQWEVVFSHMDKLGLMLHFVTQETENECLLDIGKTEVQRKLYYRELVARFSHHLAITWNLGEENGPTNWSPVGQTDQMRKDAATWLKHINPYNDVVVIHTHSNESDRHRIMAPLLGYRDIDGPSIQVGYLFDTHEQTLKWLKLSADSGKNWVVCLDEIGPASTGVKPDADDPGHDDIRKHVLWGNLMAGGAGVEWYFGYTFPNNDLNCENWRSRDIMFDQTRHALNFFQQYLPFHDMKNMDELTSEENDFCFGKPGEVYSIYLPRGGTTKINLSGQEGPYTVQWYNPRTGGDLLDGSITTIEGNENATIGDPPSDEDKDWVVLICK